MKPVFSIITAAMAVIAALVRLAVGQDGFTWIDPDAASPIPRMTDKLVEDYAQAGATDQEIADRFLVDVRVVQREFADVLRSAHGLRNVGLRSFQTALARKQNGPTLIWLGRNELGQSLNPSASGVAMPEVNEESGNDDQP